jgi:ABC-2 type transport system ATP-binding protein
MQPIVEVAGLCKAYADRTVVDHVDLDVHEGEVVGLLGANGAGKTTTVECIQGLRRADAGRIRVLGMDPGRQAEALRPLIGSQLQHSALPERMRVDEAVRLFCRGPVGEAEPLLVAFGLVEHRRRPFGALSGGQRQRLFLVLALVNRPRLVVLDELTEGLDPAARRDVWEAIRALRSAGTTVLLVTHYMDEAEALCHRVVVMRNGRVIDAGTPRQLVDRHGRWAHVRFSTDDAADRATQMRAIPGVDDAVVHGRTVEVLGDRAMIARVGAHLAAAGPIPDDLWVKVPDLEDAVIHLLRDADELPDPEPTLEAAR